MKKLHTIILLINLTTVCFGQLQDDFSDGDFSCNPIWSGSTSQFSVNASKQLQLNNTVAGQSYLSTPFSTNALDNYEWQVYVKHSFSSSATNYGRVYLVSDQSDLTKPLNGYYLQFGEALGKDAIELFHQSGSTSISICRGKTAGIASSFIVRVKVTRDNTGLWKLFVDYTGGNNFVQDASGSDLALNNSSYFGIRCTYTVANATKFYYDDFLISAPSTPPPPIPPPPPVDTTPPTAVNVKATSSNAVSILFSETLEASSAQVIANYSVDNSIGNPLTAVLQPDGKSVVLSFAKNFTSGIQNQISASGIQDLAGNTIVPVSFPFSFFQPDATSPTVANVKAPSSNSVSIAFSETVDTLSSQTVSNYFVNNSIGNPSSVSLQPDGKSVVLSFAKNFTSGIQNQISVSGVKDLAGNKIATITIPFSFFQPDTTPPAVVSVKVPSSNTVSILFSEALDISPAQLATNYSVDNSFSNPSTAVLQPDRKTVVLSFSKNFTNGVKNQISISGIKDLAGNVMTDVTLPYLFFQSTPAQNKDIIFTEIFPDPSPQVGLPTQEFVEIYNRSSNPFDVAGWKLSDGVSTATFASQIILPNQYWIICSSSNTKLFTGNVIGVSNFPTLNNDGDKLTLRDVTNKTIDSTSYSLDWYHDADKQEGGWSLEIIDVNNICSEGENWAASEDLSGGTPGRQNSVVANKPDLTGPQLLDIAPLSPTILKLTFSEKLEKDISTSTFTLTPSVSVSKKYFNEPWLRTITVEFSQALALRELYTIAVSNIHDCTGNLIQDNFSQLSFALPESADSLDVVINEVLFNPRSGGVDFVEIYNRSPKYINLKNWKLGNFKNSSISSPQVITNEDFILAPATYIAFTSDVFALTSQYPQSVSEDLFKTTLPSLPDDEGTIAIVNDQSLIIDHFGYSEKMHSPFIKDNEGVSLERISFLGLTNDWSNWKSANASASYATPGFINSNSRPESSINENAVNVDPEVFSPSVPGKDFSQINFKFDQSGLVANAKILDTQGRLVKTLANNQTINADGFFRWDGDRDDGSRARIGYYVVWVEVFDASGSINVFRKRAVIGK